MRARIEWLVARTAFPVGITASLGGAIALLHRGGAPDEVAAQVTFVTFVMVAVLERLVPLHQQWLRRDADLPADIGLALTNGVMNAVAQPVFIAAAVGAAAWFSAEHGARLWPDHWPLAAQLVPALVLGELVEYSAHRAMHEIPWLWRFHAPHHSARRLYWLNAARFHPLDLLVTGPGKLVPLAMLGADGPVIALVSVFSAVHGVFQHANLPCRLGPLNWVFSMAELHRWHHSPVADEANHNYGGNLIVWDVVFGTRWLPADRDPPVAIGIADMPNFPTDYRSILTAPFLWSRVAREAEADPVPLARGT